VEETLELYREEGIALPVPTNVRDYGTKMLAVA